MCKARHSSCCSATHLTTRKANNEQRTNALLAIFEHFRKREPFRSELFHVPDRLVDRVPAALDREEEPIRNVEAAALEVQVQRCEGLQSDEVVEDVDLCESRMFMRGPGGESNCEKDSHEM